MWKQSFSKKALRKSKNRRKNATGIFLTVCSAPLHWKYIPLTAEPWLLYLQVTNPASCVTEITGREKGNKLKIFYWDVWFQRYYGYHQERMIN